MDDLTAEPAERSEGQGVELPIHPKTSKDQNRPRPSGLSAPKMKRNMHKLLLSTEFRLGQKDVLASTVMSLPQTEPQTCLCRKQDFKIHSFSRIMFLSKVGRTTGHKLVL